MTAYIPLEAAIFVFRERIGPHPLISGGESKLDGALKAPATSWEGADLHPTIFIKAAVLLRGVAMAHAFIDGNKRLAWYLVVYFLHRNGYELQEIPATDVNNVVRSACEKEGISDEGIAAWLQRHSTRRLI